MPRKTSKSQSKASGDAQLPSDVDPTHLVALVPIQPYHVIGNIACGTGELAVALGKQTFDGRVYAFDTRQSMIDSAEGEIRRVHLSNVEANKVRAGKMPLDDDSLDGVFVGLARHKTKELKATLRDALRCLRKSGWLVLLGWQDAPTDGGPPADERFAESELRDLALEVGFRFTSRHFPSQDLFMLQMRK